MRGPFLLRLEVQHSALVLLELVLLILRPLDKLIRFLHFLHTATKAALK